MESIKRRSFAGSLRLASYRSPCTQTQGCGSVAFPATDSVSHIAFERISVSEMKSDPIRGVNMNRLAILTIVAGLFGCDRKEEALPEWERGAVKPPAKPQVPSQATLADYISNKRIYIDLDVGPGAENPFGQFNADGTYQTGAMLGGVAMTSGQPDEKGRYEVSGLTVTLSGADGGEDLVVFSTTEPVDGDQFTVTGEEGEQETVTIVRVEEAGPVVVATEKPGDEAKLDPRVVEALVAGDLETLEGYIEDGGDLDQRDKDGNTPLMVAIVFGRVDEAKAFVEGGAELDLKNKDGSTGLILAAFFGQTKTVKFLLEEGADLEIRNKEGATALDSAELPWEAAKGIVDLIGVLLHTPLGLELDYAEIEAGRPVCAQLLREAGR